MNIEKAREEINQLVIREDDYPIALNGSYAHNIIGLTLECVAKEHGNEEANKLLLELQLDELGWEPVPA